VRVHDVDGRQRLHLRKIETQRLERGLVFLLSSLCDLRPGLSATDMQISLVKELIAPAVNLNIDAFRQLAAYVFNVNSGPP
jgi:hypothetical protein